MVTRLNPINPGAPGEEISVKDLREIVQRFKHFNLSRLHRVKEFFPGRQQDFLNLLPLIFHINHPLLPGFISLETPAGIPDFFPNKQAIDAAKRFTKGFEYKRKLQRNYPIYSIFLMGSVGSMAFSRDSDIDIWLCYQPGIDEIALKELQEKTLEVEKWAASLKIEAHFFLIDNQLFKQGINTPISADSSGETQHYLLLEEFYRTAIYVAGRIPMWWMIPPAQEKNYEQYAHHLLENRFISDQIFFDFGNLDKMPQTEFVSATLWHIYKSLNSPHKSLLKLFLMESYAHEFPEPQWLCMTLKNAIYAGDFNIDNLDPYLLIYSKVDNYLLKAGSVQRLDLARECFHLKIMGSALSSLDGKTRQSRENFMQNIARKWRWPFEFLESLGMQKNWTIQKACAEHAVIHDQLQNCLAIILKITGKSLKENAGENRDLKLITRKLHAALDINEDKIEVLTTRFMVQTSPQTLLFIELPQENTLVWRLYSGDKTTKQTLSQPCIKESISLTALLCWTVVNRLYQKHINIKLISSSLKISNSEFYTLLNTLKGFLTHHLENRLESLAVYEKPNLFLSSLLLINLGEELAYDGNNQQFIMSERSDPLSYGDNRLCFIQTIQKISVTSWGEVTYHQYQGLDGFLNCITEVFNQSTPPVNIEKLNVLCFNMVRGRSITGRINNLFENLLYCFTNPETKYFQRYFVAGENSYYVFRYQDELLKHYFLDNNRQILQELGGTRPQFSPVMFDAYVLEQTFIPSLYSYNKANVIQLFCHAAGEHVAIYVIDEKGSLFFVQHDSAHTDYVLRHYSVFLNSLLLAKKLPEGINIQYYEIQKNSSAVISCQSIKVNPDECQMELRVHFTYDHQSETYAAYCNNFKIMISDADSYKTLKNHILSYRKQTETNPFHITIIDVPYQFLGIDQPTQVQAVHYLRYKQKIEDRINVFNSSTEKLLN